MCDADLIARAVPEHLVADLAAAAEDRLQMVTERGGWPKQAEERSAHRDDVMRAARVINLFAAGRCSRAQVAALAGHAVWRNEPPSRWPRTVQEADELVARLALTRDLIVLRDTLGGEPTQEDER
jgi:hypothetical protein